ncbi:unnamed protein product [Pleuronectes platessa]|uniref:Uncharacterized protein n=1 Tax=Pleuronectes platessa TaxID=8262 RepID=A0A9N7Z5M4_PLEPL|nr:unnamed protein product [Pleuronectes platessa]
MLLPCIKTSSTLSVWKTKLFGVHAALLYSLNINMWLSHDCAVPVEKEKKKNLGGTRTGSVEGGAAVETALSLVVSLFPDSSPHINDCLGVIGVDHVPVPPQGHHCSQYTAAGFLSTRQHARTCRREVSEEDDNRGIKDSEGGMRKRLNHSHPSHVAELQSRHILSGAATSSHQCKETFPIRGSAFFLPFYSYLPKDN